MLPDRVSNPGPLTYMYESGALPIALRGPGSHIDHVTWIIWKKKLFPPPLEVLYEIWLRLAYWLLRRCFKSTKHEKPWLKLNE